MIHSKSVPMSGKPSPRLYGLPVDISWFLFGRVTHRVVFGTFMRVDICRDRKRTPSQKRDVNWNPNAKVYAHGAFMERDIFHDRYVFGAIRIKT